ncbi:hypothetical protein PsorP6_018655 [Peronosclerospora sorghi]|nr:hypothetical protein PsorP6_018675 [Peronosclerospora sorghi]KAI9895609.1 hypothetical protein PsorP6_018655 [Peronosclerospora sorghi]
MDRAVEQKHIDLVLDRFPDPRARVMLLALRLPASIAAKVTRDSIISEWKWESAGLDLPTDFGSGYPSDPKYAADEIFLFPNIIRFSWGTVEPFLEKLLRLSGLTKRA